VRSSAIILVVVAVLALAGCGTTTIVTTAQSSKPEAASHATAQHKLTVGDSAVLEGERSGERLQATLLAYKETVSGGEYDTPQSGMKYVGVTLKLTDIGTFPYADSPSNGATILTMSGKQGKTALISSGECSEGFATSVKIAPGESQEGCIPFELPQEDTAAKLQWTPNSGFGEETVEWSIPPNGRTVDHPRQHAESKPTYSLPPRQAEQHAAVEKREYQEGRTPPVEMRTVAVPSVAGQSEVQALAALGSAGFTPKTATATTTEPAEVGMVLKQSPAAGHRAPTGATVTISIGVLEPRTVQTVPTAPTPAETDPGGGGTPAPGAGEG
jgi:hypothetical protein